MNGNDAQPIETLKLSERDKSRLVQAVDQQAQQQGASVNLDRRNLRVSYCGQNVLISINSTGAHIRYSVVPRNISRGGLAFIHGRFVYPETSCQVTLQQTNGEMCHLEAKVTRCRHVTGIVHEVSLQFDHPIDLDRFVILTPDENDQHKEERAQDEADTPVTHEDCPAGTVLVVDDFAADRKLLAFHLKKQRLTVEDASNITEASEAIQAKSYDLALIDIHLGREDGLKFIQQLRAGDFNGPIIAVSADPSDQMQANVMEAGANAFLVKPLDPTQLSEKVGQLMSLDIGAAGSDAVLSTMADDREMRPLLREFVSSLAGSINTLREAGSKDDSETVRSVCQQLKGAGSSYGFETITKTADLVLETLDADEKKLEEVRGSINELVGLLHRVQFV